ncbi:hypothetical protein [Cyanobium sp. ATX 6F1]|uniref:hypothetical protein n=1 Tax=Cyanobium sp. ATX 6F1 TaxID=2823702 RepID=UPI0020CC1876|nr:hypothetical protein [Cyanobium sp. ATX 6F1]MCP9917850.1 hypothetical protein [Cyanobium sp. ATX 6F1]
MAHHLPSSGPRAQRLKLALLVLASLGLMGAASAGSKPAVKTSAAAPAGSQGIEAVSPSTLSQIALADHLRAKGAIFYGAWWCSHCFHQKNLFGTEAARKLPYLECDKDDQGRQKCVAAKVKAFPTWVLGSERREGVQSLAELSAWSGFKGATK